MEPTTLAIILVNQPFPFRGDRTYGSWNTSVRLSGIEREGRNHDYDFEFFKPKNPVAWQRTQTFVIDKHDVEWRVLEKCFPDAFVLLCQFHALSYWKKILRSKFGLKAFERGIAQRCCDEVAWQKLLTAAVQIATTTYLRWYEELVTFANGGHLSVLKYFNANWKGCCSIWANYRCNEYFHADNTISNRIESNWNLLKRLLGKTTRIDNMTASLLSHQRAVIDQVLYDIQRHGLRSNPPATIHDFLRRISVLMCKYVLKRTVGNVCGELVDYNLPKKEACTWELFTKSSVFTCDDFAWTCTCAPSFFPVNI
ncbi:LOW QUALITY PROTEIN: hypothetical protein PHMEG_00027076 [Phytophthora megakarya]|uniref:ZSWIM1/3 RNaseH-like domain-containing protein n=1 Tax=Phytophthora megakarya TaxID=4795 RepID=A0A225V818_9STRA|nr:LOW QUALITY PROTEIN: hypothetical protein PHMEG_00027076 [Phytophthora megakarya]